jgi:hypothetical protein
MSYIVRVQEDENGELYIVLPPELIEQTDWSERDDIEWVVEVDDKILLRKRETDDSSPEA